MHETNGSKFDSIEDCIEAIRNDGFVIVLDSPTRENEGDLIIAAQAVTTAQMAFLIRWTSGLICAPLPAARAEPAALDLPQMVPAARNADPNRTAYTVSVDASADAADALAAARMTTGISAHDRALTCRVLAAPASRPSDLRRPGHVFPLRARPGGVRERRGHTEAAVDLCRLAGKKVPVGVIAEMVVDGEVVGGEAAGGGSVAPELKGSGMLRTDGCIEFGRRWGIPVCTIEHLKAYIEDKEGKLVLDGNGDG